MSRVELYERIRRDSREEGLSVRAPPGPPATACTAAPVREALASATPPGRKAPVRESTAPGPWTEIIRAWLTADRQAPRKQRHTARRVWQRLVAEHGTTVSESTVRA